MLSALRGTCVPARVSSERERMRECGVKFLVDARDAEVVGAIHVLYLVVRIAVPLVQSDICLMKRYFIQG